MINRNIFVLTYIVMVGVFLTGCKENLPEPEEGSLPLAKHLEGVWQLVEVTFDEVPMDYFNNFQLVIKVTDSDTLSGIFNAIGVPEGGEGIWPDTTSWTLLSENLTSYTILREDTVEIEVWLTDSLIMEMGSFPGECPLSEEEGYMCGINGEWRFEMGKLED